MVSVLTSSNGDIHDKRRGKNMKDKIILITGGASGIGFSTAKKLSKENKVIIADCKKVEDSFINNNFEYSENISFFRCDISKKEDILNLKDFILNKFTKLDLSMQCGNHASSL